MPTAKPPPQPRKRRLASSEARRELSSILREFAGVEEPSSSIGERAVRLGIKDRDSAVVVPLADFEQALELEEVLAELLLEVAVAERIARGPGGAKPVEELAKEFGLE